MKTAIQTLAVFVLLFCESPVQTADRPAGWGEHAGFSPLEWSGEWQAVPSPYPELFQVKGPYNRLSLKLREAKLTNNYLSLTYNGVLLEYDTMRVKTHEPCRDDDNRTRLFDYSFTYQVVLTSVWFRTTSGELTFQGLSGGGTNTSPLPAHHSLGSEIYFRSDQDFFGYPPATPPNDRLYLVRGVFKFPPGSAANGGDSCAGSFFGGDDHGTDFFTRVASTSEDLNLRGTVKGTLRSAAQTNTEKDYAVETADVLLYRQTAFLRERRQDESVESYEAYLRQWRRNRQLIQRTRVEPSDEGKFAFDNVPLLQLDSQINGVWTASHFSLDIIAAHTEEWFMDSNSNIDTNRTQTLFFAEKTVNNVFPDRDFLIELQPIDAIGQKASIAEGLIALGPTYYSDAESKVLAYLDLIKSGQIPASEERIEGIRRAIWAERAVRDGALLSKELIELAFESLATVLADLYGDFADWTRQDISAGKKELERVEERIHELKLKPEYAAQFKLSADDLPAANSWSRTLDAARMAEKLDTIKKTIEALKPALQASLTAAGMDQETAEKVALGFQQLGLLIAGRLQTMTVPGALQDATKAVIEAVVPLAAPVAFDDPTRLFYCYTRHTEDYLHRSFTRMTNWNSADSVIYSRDRTEALVHMNALNDEATFLIQTLAYARFAAEALDLIENTAGAFGAVSPSAKGVELAAQLSKYAANLASIEAALGYPFIRAPMLLRRATDGAFGFDSSSQQQRSIPPPGSGYASFNVPIPNETNLLAELTTMTSVLLTNDVGSAHERFFLSTNGYQKDRSDYWKEIRWFRSHAQSIAPKASFDASSYFARIRDAASVLEQREAEFESVFRSLLFKVLTSEYSGTNSAVYIAERNRAIDAAESYIERIELFDSLCTNLVAQFEGSLFLPTIALDVVAIYSDTTGLNYVTQTNESFTVKAALQNLSSNEVSQLSIALQCDSPFIHIDAPSIDNVTLAANQTLSTEWKIRYVGDLSWRVFYIEPQISGSEPFSPSTATAVLPVDSSVLYDTDQDEIPDEWEVQHSIPVGSSPEDDQDDDGLSDLSELRFRTHPRQPDTDQDGILDGEEVFALADGVKSSPTLKDTDFDGLSDPLDPAPADPFPAATTARETVNEFALSSEVVYLTSQNRVAWVQVASGENSAPLWTAQSANPALVRVTPELPGKSSGYLLVIEAASSFPFTLGQQVETTVRLVNLQSGLNREISVVLSGGFATLVRARTSGDNVELSWDPTSGKTYQVEYSSDLNVWNSAGVPVRARNSNTIIWVDSGPPNTLSRPKEAHARYYRVKTL